MLVRTDENRAVSTDEPSQIGFIATSYLDGSLFLVDTRGPRVMYRNLPDLKSGRKSFLHKHELDPIELLTWTVSGTAAGKVFPAYHRGDVYPDGFS